MNTRININNLPQVRGEYKFDEPLSRYTWLNVGGPADVVFYPQDEADLQDFLRQKDTDIPVFVIGGGANLLVRDGGIRGVVIKLAHKNFSKWQIKDNILYCGGGCLNFSLQKVVAENGLGGLEFLCSIPGTVGGAMRSNAGCFGSDISQVLQTARIMNGKGEIHTVAAADFNLEYRQSNFPADWVVLEVGLKFIKSKPEEVAAKIAQNAEYRKKHQPQGIKTAGSTFKNPEGCAAWKLIKEAEADKIKVGNAKLSPQHCNFLQNEGNSAADVEDLCKKVQNIVNEKCGIALELEVKIVGQE